MVKGVFSVRSSLQHNRFPRIQLLNEAKCTCELWETFHYPCNTSFFGEEWDFESLPSHYRNSVFITLDTGNLGVASKLDGAVFNNDNNDKVERGRQDSITEEWMLRRKRRMKKRLLC